MQEKDIVESEHGGRRRQREREARRSTKPRLGLKYRRRSAPDDRGTSSWASGACDGKARSRSWPGLRPASDENAASVRVRRSASPARSFGLTQLLARRRRTRPRLARRSTSSFHHLAEFLLRSPIRRGAGPLRSTCRSAAACFIRSVSAWMSRARSVDGIPAVSAPRRGFLDSAGSATRRPSPHRRGPSGLTLAEVAEQLLGVLVVAGEHLAMSRSSCAAAAVDASLGVVGDLDRPAPLVRRSPS